MVPYRLPPFTMIPRVLLSSCSSNTGNRRRRGSTCSSGSEGSASSLFEEDQLDIYRQLEQLICFDIPNCLAKSLIKETGSSRSTLYRQVLEIYDQQTHQFLGMSSRSSSAEVSATKDWLCSVVSDGIYTSRLSESVSLQIQIHSWIGIIQEMNGELQSACVSLTRAGWLAVRRSKNGTSKADAALLASVQERLTRVCSQSSLASAIRRPRSGSLNSSHTSSSLIRLAPICESTATAA